MEDLGTKMFFRPKKNKEKTLGASIHNDMWLATKPARKNTTMQAEGALIEVCCESVMLARYCKFCNYKFNTISDF